MKSATGDALEHASVQQYCKSLRVRSSPLTSFHWQNRQ
jgi:hypothetical protein